MAKRFNAKEILTPAIVLFLIAFVCTALLALTNNFTAKKIEDSKEKGEIATRDKIFSQAKKYGEDKKIAYENQDYFYCTAIDEKDEIIGYIFTTKEKGYGGNIVVMTGIDNKNGKLTGVEILEINETAGLGMNAKNDSFKNQFVDSTGKFEVVKNGAKDNQIQALTGATITSSAVTNAVNTAIDLYQTVMGGEKQ